MSPGPHVLVLARHGQSEGNRQNIFTGWRDLPLTARGKEEARLAAVRLLEMGVVFDAAYSSELSRSSASCSIILETMGQVLSFERSAALNERDYGDLTGLNKDQARRQFGEDQVHIWRRSYEVAPPHGESLRDTIARVLPYYLRVILPAVMRSRAALVVAHGNSLRALILALEGLTPEKILKMELGTAEMRFYRVRDDTFADLTGTWSVSPQ